MAQAAIRSTDLEAGRVPEVCAKTGRRASGTVRTTAQREPGTFREILPGGRGTTIELPASSEAIRLLKLIRARFIGWIVVGLVLLAIAIFAGVKILYPIAIGLLVGGYIESTWAKYRNWVGARVDDDEVWVHRAHADFCRAAGRIYGQDRAPNNTPPNNREPRSEINKGAE